MAKNFLMLKKGQLARNVAIIIFMEELENAGYTYHEFLAYCDSLHCECAVSPVHDKDEYTAGDVRRWVDRHIDPDHYSFISADIAKVREIAPKVGDKKKAHIHVLIKYPGRNQGKFYSDLFGNILDLPPTRWQKVLNVDSYLRYFAHMDTPAAKNKNGSSLSYIQTPKTNTSGQNSTVSKPHCR